MGITLHEIFQTLSIAERRLRGERWLAWGGLGILDSFVFDPDLDYNVAITLRNTDVELLEKVNAILDDLKWDGSLTRLFAGYGITYRAPKSH